MFLVKSNLFLKNYIFSWCGKQVRISTNYYGKIIRFKSNDISTTINKNTPVLNKGVHVLSSRKSSNELSFAEQLVAKSPANVQPYLKLMRMHKPIGSWLLFWPCGWSISLAAAPSCWPDPYLLTLFGTGAFLMRGAGCTINDMWDKDIDSKVTRTKDRPLVNGSINMRHAWLFLAGQLSFSLLILLQLNWYSVFLGASSLALVTTYPLAKRITHWPQLILGMTFNWGILLGYSAVHGYVDWALCLPMYVAGICWTIIYDTIYAYQDISDDLMLGLKSTAIRFKSHTKKWLTGFSFLTTTGLTTAGIMASQTLPYYTAVGVVSSHIAWQIYSLNIENPKDCANKFVSNFHVGFILFVGIILGNLFKENKSQKIKNI